MSSGLHLVVSRKVKPDLGKTIHSMLSKGMDLEDSGDIEAAASTYDDVLRLDPKNAIAANNLGTLYYTKRRFVRAEELFRIAAEDANYAHAHYNLGNVLDELNRVPEAITAYLHAIKVRPTYAEVYHNLALAYERVGEPRLALSAWTKFLQLESPGKDAAQARSHRKTLLDREKITIVQEEKEGTK